MRRHYDEDPYYSDDARSRDLKLIWRCDSCHAEREDYPGTNEGGTHYGCGGEWQRMGESYGSPRW